MTEHLSASMENYLETILRLVSEKGAARCKDIAQRAKVNKASVTGALRSLSERGLVNYAPYGLVTLTPKGKKYAKQVLRRHETLHDFFLKILRIDHEQAEAAACEMEHALTPLILERLARFIDFMELCPRGIHAITERFSQYCGGGKTYRFCDMCMAAIPKKNHA